MTIAAVAGKNMSADSVFEALKDRYPKNAYALLEQVGNATGYGTSRHIDAIAMSLWPSRGLYLEGIEIKVSRNDFRREIKDPMKAEELATFCDFWWIAAPAGVVPVDQLPPNWGLLEVTPGKCKIVKQAVKLTPKPITKEFFAALLRRVYAADTPAHHIDQVREKALEEGRLAGIRISERTADAAQESLDRLLQSVQAFQEKSGIRIDAYNGEKIGEAVVQWQMRANEASLLTRLRRVERETREMAERCAREIAQLEQGFAPK